MNRAKTFLKLILITLSAMAFTACSKTVQWEEEVLLNTGETIVVKRHGTYSLQLQAGNPFDIRLSPDPVSTIEFIYKGKKYSHTDDVGLVLLAISPEEKPTLVTSPQNTDWQWKHNYLCAMPSYVQLQFDSSQNTWVWPPQIEYWLYKLPTNLSLGIATLSEDGQRLTVTQIKTKNASAYGVGPQFQYIDPTFQSRSCKRSK